MQKDRKALYKYLKNYHTGSENNVTRFNKYIFSLSATSARLLSATVKK